MSKLGAYARIAFCPLCGIESLEKDRYREAKNCPVAEYICKTCGFGFRVGPSARVEAANSLQKRDRALRIGKPSDDVSPEVLDKFSEYMDGPLRRMSMRTWVSKWLPKFREARPKHGCSKI